MLRQRSSSPVAINRNTHRIRVPPAGYRPDRSYLSCRHPPILWTLPTLRGADLSGAVLFRATLTGANLSYADLFRATLSRADLRDAENLTQAQLDAACGEPPKLAADSGLQWDAKRPCPEEPVVAPPLNQDATP